MSDFIFWNMIFAICWVAWKCFTYLLPKHVTFTILDVSISAVYGVIGTVLINEQKWKVSKTGSLWRFSKDGKVVIEEWAEKLDQYLAELG